MDFVAIDVETANESPGSICQIGMIRFQGGEIAGRFSTMVDPDGFFSKWATNIHGFTVADCFGSPTFKEIYPDVKEFAGTSTLVSHSRFDRAAIRQACLRYGLADLPNPWLDSCRAARRTWPELKRHDLKSVCAHVGHQLENHHCAQTDAIAAGVVLLACCRQSGNSLFELASSLPTRLQAPDYDYDRKVRRDGNPDGPYAGETISFTGSLQVSRSEAAGIAAELGFTVAEPMSLKTTVLIVGDQDVLSHRGVKASNKMRKAEEMAAKGHPIRVLSETDFYDLVAGES